MQARLHPNMVTMGTDCFQSKRLHCTHKQEVHRRLMMPLTGQAVSIHTIHTRACAFCRYITSSCTCIRSIKSFLKLIMTLCTCDVQYTMCNIRTVLYAILHNDLYRFKFNFIPDIPLTHTTSSLGLSRGSNLAVLSSRPGN